MSAPRCCRAGTGSWWLSTRIDITQAMRDEAEPVARYVAARYDAGGIRTYVARGRDRLEIHRASSIAELAVIEALPAGGVWGRGDPKRPDIDHPIYGAVEVRWTWHRAGHVPIRPHDDHGSRYVLAVPGIEPDVVDVLAWAFGSEVREHGLKRPPTGRGSDEGEYWLAQEQAHRLPFHKPKRD